MSESLGKIFYAITKSGTDVDPMNRTAGYFQLIYEPVLIVLQFPKFIPPPTVF